MVTLYNGGQYHLYTFKKFTDIRLVFAPEQQIAFYGGDPWIISEFLRYDLDICFFPSLRKRQDRPRSTIT